MKYSLLPTLKIIYKDDPQKLELYTREYLEEEKKIQRREEVKAEILPHVRYSRLSEYDLEQIMTQYGVEHVHQSFQRANTGDSLSLVKRFFTELRKRYTRTAAELNT